MLTHDNIFSNVAVSRTKVPFAGEDTALSFLPLSHIFERMAGHYLMFATGTSISLRRVDRHRARESQEVKPTLVLSVPAAVREDARSRSGPHRRISQEEDFLLGTWRRRAMGE
jgi:long-subunit acyl-CoA synthetase (AMP-forming)